MKKKTPQFMQYYYDKYLHSNDTQLTDVYSSPSHLKLQAYIELKNYYTTALYGGGYRIIGYNTHNFTVAFVGMHTDTGEAIFCVKTKQNLYYCLLGDLQQNL